MRVASKKKQFHSFMFTDNKLIIFKERSFPERSYSVGPASPSSSDGYNDNNDSDIDGEYMETLNLLNPENEDSTSTESGHSDNDYGDNEWLKYLGMEWIFYVVMFAVYIAVLISIFVFCANVGSINILLFITESTVSLLVLFVVGMLLFF